MRLAGSAIMCGTEAVSNAGGETVTHTGRDLSYRVSSLVFRHSDGCDGSWCTWPTWEFLLAHGAPLWRTWSVVGWATPRTPFPGWSKIPPYVILS